MPSNKKWYKRWWAIIFFILLGLIILILSLSGLYFLKKVKTYQAGQGVSTQGNISAQVSRELKNQKKYPNPKGTNVSNYYSGTTSPEVTIVQFADFTCPYSREAYSTIRKIGLNYPEHVKIVFRDFPSDQKALNLSMAANCAGEQGFFWPMYDKLFSNQEDISPNNIDQLTNLAQQLGADTSQFKNCLKQNKYLSEIKKDVKDGQKMNVQGTPTYFINGHKISGNVPYNLFQNTIEGLLQE